jgi:phospholipid transport system substrate-binding protein
MTHRLQEAQRGIRRRTLLPFIAGLALAATGRSAPIARADTADAVDGPLRELHNALEATMRAGRSIPFPRRFDALAPVVDHVFDLETVLKVSVGVRWDSMDDDVRTRLLKAYRRFTVATYVANFDKYDGETFRIIPGLRDAGTDRIVGTEIINDGGERFRLDYVMRDVRGTWRAVDVLLEGSISRVAVQRSDFRKILANGDPDALIASLKRKIADLSDGALNS